MPRILKVHEAELIKLLMNYFKKKNMYRTLVTLEQEAQVSLEPLSKEMRFFRSLVLEGNFEEAENFIHQFKQRLGDNHALALFELKKQRYFELIESKPDVEVLIKVMKEIEQLVPDDVYKNLCYFLTLKSINDHPEYLDWSIQKGRISCFESIKPIMRSLGRNFQPQGDPYQYDIQQVVETLLLIELQNQDHIRHNQLIEIEQLMKANQSFLIDAKKQTKLEFIQSDQNQKVIIPQSQIYNPNTTKRNDDLMSQSVQVKQNPIDISYESYEEQNDLHETQQSQYYQQPPQLKMMHSLQSHFEESHLDFNKSKYSEQNTYTQKIPENKSILVSDVQKSKSPKLMEETKSKVKLEETKPKGKLAFHNRIKSNEGVSNDQILVQSHQVHGDHPQPQYNSFMTQKRGPSNLYSFRNEAQQQYLSNHSRNKSSGEQDKNIIIEKLYISDCQNEGSENELDSKPQSSSHVFNYNYEDMIEAGYLTDTHPIRAATFSSDGDYFAIGTNSKCLRIYSMKSLLNTDGGDGPLQIPVTYEKNNHHLGSIYCIDWSRKGRLIATGSNDKFVKVMKVPELLEFTEDQTEEVKLVGHKGIVRTLGFTHDETKLLSAGQVDTCIKVWDVGTGQLIRNLEGHTQAIYCLQVGGDGSYQVSAGLDKTLRLWDLRQSKPIATIQMGNYAEINYVSLSESANNFALEKFIKNSKKSHLPTIRAKQSLAALAHSDGSVSVWDLPSQKCVRLIQNHQMDCRSVEFDPTARYLVTASFDQTISIHDYEQQRLVTTIKNHEDRVVLCKWHPFYPFILSTSADSTARVFAPNGFINQLIKSFHSQS